jgi:Tfp pilus assembly protein PilE
METYRDTEKGFTFFELCIVLCIIAIIMALLAASFSGLVSRSKETKAMNDCKRVGDAMEAWDLAHGGDGSETVTMPPPEGQITLSNFSPISTSQLQSLLVPNYISSVPVNDGWGHPYLYFLKNNNPASPDAVMCISLGRDGGTNTSPLSTYTFDTFPSSDFDQDIVWSDGHFVRNQV